MLRRVLVIYYSGTGLLKAVSSHLPIVIPLFEPIYTAANVLCAKLWILTHADETGGGGVVIVLWEVRERSPGPGPGEDGATGHAGTHLKLNGLQLWGIIWEFKGEG